MSRMCFFPYSPVTNNRSASIIRADCKSTFIWLVKQDILMLLNQFNLNAQYVNGITHFDFAVQCGKLVKVRLLDIQEYFCLKVHNFCLVKGYKKPFFL